MFIKDNIIAETINVCQLEITIPLKIPDTIKRANVFIKVTIIKFLIYFFSNFLWLKYTYILPKFMLSVLYLL